MARLTITIDDQILRRARMRALEQGTSVDAVLRKHLEAYASSAGSTWDQAVNTILELSRSAASGRDDQLWSRDEIHERDRAERFGSEPNRSGTS